MYFCFLTDDICLCTCKNSGFLYDIELSSSNVYYQYTCVIFIVIYLYV